MGNSYATSHICEWMIAAYLLSCTISKMADYRPNFRCRHNGGEPVNAWLRNLAHKYLETSLYRNVQSIIRYVEPYKRDSRLCDRQTDGQTDFPTASAALHCVLWPIKYHNKSICDDFRNILCWEQHFIKIRIFRVCKKWHQNKLWRSDWPTYMYR